jgi:arylsulfatase A-like enzyme
VVFRKLATYLILFATAAVWFSMLETGVTLLREGPGVVDRDTAVGLFVVVTALHFALLLTFALASFAAVRLGGRWLRGHNHFWSPYLSFHPDARFETSSRLIAVAVAVGAAGVSLYLAFAYSLKTFHAPDLIAQLLSVVTVVIMLGTAVLVIGLTRVLSRLISGLSRRWPIVKRLLSPRVVLMLMLGGLALIGLALLSINRELFRQIDPMNALFGASLLLITLLAVLLIERDRPEVRGIQHSKRLGFLVVGCLAATFICLHMAEDLLSHDLSVRTLFFLRMPRHTTLAVDLLQRLSDSDGDGYSRYFGGRDCNDQNPDIHPNAIEIPGNGVDENCMAGDYPLVETLDTTEFEGLERVTNVILITVDSLRPDLMSVYGYGQNTTPNLKRVASEGCTVFTNAYSASVATMPALLAMQAGRLRSAVSLTWDGALNPRVHTLPRLMAEFGFDTRAQIIPRTLHHDILSGFTVENLGEGIPYEQLFNAATGVRFVDGAIRLFSGYQPYEKPIFLFQHWLDPHSPYIRHKGFDQFGKDTRARYLSEVAYTDYQLGRLFDYLKQSGRMADTLVIISADHGEAFHEHESEYHGESLYEEEVRIPLIICAPGAPPSVIDTPVSLLDIAPTVLAAVGQFAPLTMSGRPLLNAVYGRTLTERAVVAEIVNPKPIRMLVEGGWKIIHYPLQGMAELFDLVNDPKETTNRLFSDPEQAGARYAMLLQIMDSVSASFGRRLLEILVPKLPDGLNPLTVDFEKGPRLLAASLEKETLGAGQTLKGTFFWQARKPMDGPLFSHFSLLDENGKQVWSMADPTPAFADYPTQLWRPGDLVRDELEVLLPENLPSGELSFCMGISDQGRALTPSRSAGLRIEKKAVCVATLQVTNEQGDRAEYVLDEKAGALLEPLLRVSPCAAESISIAHNQARLSYPGKNGEASVMIVFHNPARPPADEILAQGGSSLAVMMDGELSPSCRSSLPDRLKTVLDALVWIEPGDSSSPTP